MKSNFKRSLRKAFRSSPMAPIFVGLILPLAAAFWVGCQSKTVPVGAYQAPSSLPNYYLVSNFEGNLNPTPEPTNAVNSHLFETGVSGNVVQEPGLWAPINNFPTLENCIMTITGPGANG